MSRDNHFYHLIKMHLNLTFQIHNSEVVLSLIDDDLILNDEICIVNHSNLYQCYNTVSAVIPEYNSIYNRLETLNCDQKLVALYFLLNTCIFPKELIKRWLTDSNLSSVDADCLADSISMMQIENLEKIFEASSSVYFALNPTTKTRLYPIQKITHLQDLLDKQSTTKSLLCYDTILGKLDREPYLDISSLPETLFQIEDKRCIIIGLSVNYTTLIISLTAKDGLKDQLCDLVPLGLRDKLSMFRAMQRFPEINEILKSYFKRIEFYGLSANGSLSLIDLFDSWIDNSDFQTIPLYLKIIK